MMPRPSQATPSPAQVALYHTAFALLAYGHRHGLMKPQAPKVDIVQTLAELEAASGGIDPLVPMTPDGLPLMPALLRFAEHPHGTQWLDAWAERHGTETVFAVPEGDEGVVLRWMKDTILPDLTKDRAPHQNDVHTAVWLIRNAPEASIAALPLAEWREIFLATQTKPGVAGLAQALEARIPTQDAERKPLARWTNGATGDDDRKVVGLSGRERSMREFQTLYAHRSHHSERPALTGDAILHLPRPPHLQRDNFVKDILLRTTRELDERRALLWSVADAKIEIVSALMTRLEQARRKGDTEVFERGVELLQARDALGRGFVAFLLGGQEQRMAEVIHRALQEWGADVAASVDEEALTPDGAGLAEQEIMGLMAAQKHSQVSDAFTRRTQRALQGSDDALLGRPERREALVDFVVDAGAGLDGMSLAVFELGEALARTAETDAERLRLNQAMLLRRLMMFFRHLHLGNGFPDSRELATLNGQFTRYLEGDCRAAPGDTFADHVGRHGLLLDMDADDWRQLGLFGREKVREILKSRSISGPSTASQAANRLFSQLDRIMAPALEAQRLHAMMPGAEPHAPRRRARM